MASVNFYPRDKNTIGKTTINLFLSVFGKRFKISTKIDVPLKYWDESKQRVKSQFPGAVEKNAVLNHLAEEIPKLVDRKYREGKPVSRRDLLELVQPKAVTETVRSFLEVYQDWIDSAKNEKKLNTIKNYRTSFGHLESYIGRNDLGFDDIDLQFYEDFKNYLFVNQNQENNTVGSHIKNLKAFMSWAYDRGLHQNTSFQKFKVMREHKPVIHLTREEFEHLDQLDLSDNPRLERVRDLFVLQCSTGLRFSDLAAIKKENIKSDHFLISTLKVNKTVTIPFNGYSKRIILKYGDQLPKISEQKLNEYIKEVCQLAEINDPVYYYKLLGSKRIDVHKPKWEFVTSHTARRTFITQSLERGIPPEVIMEYTGHSDIRIMMRYVGITDRWKFDQMKKWG